MAIKNVNVSGGGNMMMTGNSPVKKKCSQEETEFMEHGGKVKVYKLSPEELEKELQRVGFYRKQYKYIPTKKERQRIEDEEEKQKEDYEIEKEENEVSLNELQDEEYDSSDEDDYEEKEC